mmetsp:Transcript_11316/g.16624  ORF Transcript_11316/g.16624 Transcript_11316/m.16624 type:complete len:375 (-) Transcript_11316:16-1140(-)
MTSSSNKTKWLDRLETSLNACSLETLDTYTKSRRIPLVIGCYELDTDTSNGSDRRNGQLLLHSIDLEDLKFNHQQTIDVESGVLDGKWFHPQTTTTEETAFYATANASGSIHIYELLTNNETDKTMHLKHINASNAVPEDGLALSLGWDKSSTAVGDQKRIISSYSKGSLALHTMRHSADDIEQMHRWKAHSLFGCDSEVWTCCFASNDHQSENTERILSGGDDCQLKLWDLRLIDDSSHNTAVGTNRDFDAGITAVSYHPSKEHIFAVGSYDEQVRLFDVRNIMEPLKCIDVGGGVWRIKWQQSSTTTDTLLVAAMHGGCRILNVNDDGNCKTVRKEFVEHKSMAYGADWIAKNVAASCSFYDRQVFLWNSCK